MAEFNESFSEFKTFPMERVKAESALPPVFDASIAKDSALAKSIELTQKTVGRIFGTPIIGMNRETGILDPHALAEGHARDAAHRAIEAPRGSAVVVTENGLVLTSHHETVRQESYSMKLDGQEYPLTEIKRDVKNDLAVFQIVTPDCKSFQAMPMGNSGDLQAGDSVYLSGYSYSSDMRTSLGVFARSGATADLLPPGTLLGSFITADQQRLRSSVSIRGGYSGGATTSIDRDGITHLVGISLAGDENGTYAFSAPIEGGKKLLAGAPLACSSPVINETFDSKLRYAKDSPRELYAHTHFDRHHKLSLQSQFILPAAPPSPKLKRGAH